MESTGAIDLDLDLDANEPTTTTTTARQLKNRKKRAQRAKAKADAKANADANATRATATATATTARKQRRREICSVKGCGARLQLCAGCRIIKYCSADKQREDWQWHGWWCRRFPAARTRKAERRFLQDIDAAINAPPSPAPADALCGCAGAIHWTLETLREMRPTLRNGAVAVLAADADADADDPKAAAAEPLSACGTAYVFNVVLETHRRLAARPPELPSLVGLVQLTFVRPPPGAHPSTLPRLDRAELRPEARGDPAAVAAFDDLVGDSIFQNITSRFGRESSNRTIN